VKFNPNGENELASQTLKLGVAAAPEDPSLLYHLAVYMWSARA
jgi:hypothetical protein